MSSESLIEEGDVFAPIDGSASPLYLAKKRSRSGLQVGEIGGTNENNLEIPTPWIPGPEACEIIMKLGPPIKGQEGGRKALMALRASIPGITEARELGFGLRGRVRRGGIGIVAQQLFEKGPFTRVLYTGLEGGEEVQVVIAGFQTAALGLSLKPHAQPQPTLLEWTHAFNEGEINVFCRRLEAAGLRTIGRGSYTPFLDNPPPDLDTTLSDNGSRPPIAARATFPDPTESQFSGYSRTFPSMRLAHQAVTYVHSVLSSS
ncbi:MAG: hypothetical protein WC924_04560 [Candidatus Gracilibacteria bacterium]